MDEKVEVKLPYFTDIHYMHWFAQPFAIVAILLLSIIYLAVIVAGWIAFTALAIVAFIIAMPFILLSETFSWIRGWFRYKRY